MLLTETKHTLGMNRTTDSVRKHFKAWSLEHKLFMFTIRPQVQNYSLYRYRKCVHRLIVSPGSDFVLQRVSLVPDRGQFIIRMEKRHLQVPQSTISEDEFQNKSGIVVL